MVQACGCCLRWKCVGIWTLEKREHGESNMNMLGQRVHDPQRESAQCVRYSKPVKRTLQGTPERKPMVFSEPYSLKKQLYEPHSWVPFIWCIFQTWEIMRNHRPFYHIKNHNHIKALSFNHGTPILHPMESGSTRSTGSDHSEDVGCFSQLQEIMVDVGEITYLGSYNTGVWYQGGGIIQEEPKNLSTMKCICTKHH